MHLILSAVYLCIKTRQIYDADLNEIYRYAPTMSTLLRQSNDLLLSRSIVLIIKANIITQSTAIKTK